MIVPQAWWKHAERGFRKARAYGLLHTLSFNIGDRSIAALEREAIRSIFDELVPVIEDHYRIERAELEAKNTAKDAQINALAEFISHNVPGEPSQSQGAVDTAIRVLGALQAENTALRKLDPEGEARPE